MSSQGPLLEYQSREPRVPTHVGAWVVMVLALLAAVGFFLIVPAIVVLIAAIAVRNMASPFDARGRALATIATWVSFGSGVAGVLFLVLMPSSGRMGPSPRSTCAANLRGITQSMNVYAADNGDVFPIVGDSYTSTLASAASGTPAPDTVLLSNKVGGLYAGKPVGNVVQSMWLLVISGQVAPKQFICHDDPAAAAAAPATVRGTSNYYANFSNDLSYSYSFAFMWDGTRKMGDWWKSDTDAGLPLIADMAPANGTGSPKTNTLDGTNRLANSRNHKGDGQNVGYADGHAEFARLANVGHANDNIYSANGAGGPSASGVWASSVGDPGISGGSKGNWDVVLVPAADGGTNVRR